MNMRLTTLVQSRWHAMHYRLQNQRLRPEPGGEAPRTNKSAAARSPDPIYAAGIACAGQVEDANG